ncbi:MAG TPA: UDP-glucuronic acid decarboxylase family protein [Patescibacteria group bacterium]
MAKILVAGGAGFIGSNLCKYLLDQKNQVICLDNLYTGRKKNIAGLFDNPDFQFIDHDITKPVGLTGLDQIYNLACPASPPAYQKDPVFTWKTSVFGIYNLLELSKINGNIPILQTSTSEVYGDPLVHPQKESYWGNVNPCGLRSCYDEGKRAAETICFDYFRQFDTPIRVIRIFNTYGPNMDPDDGRVVSNFIMEALQNRDITMYGDGLQTRSFQYVSDLINGMDKMMNNQIGFAGPVNIGNPEEYSMIDLAGIILKLIPESTSKIIYKPSVADDPKVRRPDNSLAKEKLSWQPVVKVEDGLRKTIEYFRQEIMNLQMAL